MDTARVRALIEKELPELIAIRRDLHAHPELGYQERRTSGVVVRELARLGIAHKAGYAGGTGVVAHLPATAGARSGEGAVGLRADMDALPIEERTGAAYASTTHGVMHACGHDGHTANLLGVARVLSAIERPRPVTLVFQPAEEGGAGGKRMCEEGALAGDGADGRGGGLGTPVGVMYGLHGWPQLALGKVATRPGPLLAATDNFVVTVRGRQSHAAQPHLGRDPIVCASAVIGALQSIASRAVSPTDSVVVTVGTIQGGTARNIIPESVTFAGTARTLTPQTRETARERFFALARGVAAGHGCEAQITWEEGYPVTSNDPGATERFFAVARGVLGDSRVETVPTPTMGGEDFSYYGRHVPACFYVLGLLAEGRAEMPALHQPEFDFNDAALATGIETMCALALNG